MKLWKNVTPLAGMLLIGATLTGPVALGALPTAVDGEPLPSLAPMIKHAAPAVVNIAVRGETRVNRGAFNDPFFRDFFGNPPATRETRAAGSGVIIDARNGYIMTNHHVIEGATEITVTLLDDRSLDAQIVGSDPGSDVALIQVDATNLSQIPLADSEAIEVGDFVVAIGNPFGFSNSVTSGIVSGLGRYGLSRQGYEDFIQTDAAINPGNSGGALLNLRGELVGINTAILSRSGGNQGIGFAIPINLARSIMEQILEYGEVRRGLLGVNIIGISQVQEELRETLDLPVDYGALVLEVVPDSAADKAGIEVEDVVISVNGAKTKNAAELRNSIGLMNAGEEVDVTLIRNGRERTLKARLGSRAEPQRLQASTGTPLHPGLEGASFEERSGNRPRSDSAGVVVASVTPGSPAAERGLEEGDIITRVNRKRVDSLEAFQDAAGENAGQLMLTVERNDSLQLIMIN